MHTVPGDAGKIQRAYATMRCMSMRPWDLAPLLAIALGMITAQYVGLEGVTTAFFSLAAVLVGGYVVGRRLLPEASVRTVALWGACMALAALMLLRGAWFYAGGFLGGWGDVWTTGAFLGLAVLATVVLSLTEKKFARRARQDRASQNITVLPAMLEILSILVSLAGVGLIGYVAWKLGTVDAIRTPWPLLPGWTLPMIGLLWALTLVGAWRETPWRWGTGIQAACALAATAIITPLFYKIGFGFDGFLHVAGERVLAETGTLSPKPPYYMGQYVLVTWVAQLFSLSVATVDRWLVAAMATFLIPAATLLGKRTALRLPALVLVPIAPFVATTPHGVASVLAVTSLLSYPQGDEAPLPGAVVALLFAAWASLTHPLVGLPVLGAVVAALLWRVRHWMRYPLSLLTAVGAGVAVPIVFGLAASLGSSARVAFNWGAVTDVATWYQLLQGLVPWAPNRYAVWAQSSVWIVEVLPWITVLLAGIAVIRRLVRMLRREPMHSVSGLPFLVTAFVTLLAALVMQLAGDFAFLIDYERGNYTERLFGVALLLLLPVATPTLAWLLEKARRAAIPSAVGTILTVALLGAGASYAALPRHDAVTPSRGWSVGASDIATVRVIDRDAAGEAYTVLANQSVSAAAVREFGFARYHNDIFFYPIPTGGALYDVFLRASYEDPGRETMRAAAALGGSQLVYLVINDYWWDAEALSERAAAEADRTFVIHDGNVTVFKYVIE